MFFLYWVDRRWLFLEFQRAFSKCVCWGWCAVSFPNNVSLLRQTNYVLRFNNPIHLIKNNHFGALANFPQEIRLNPPPHPPTPRWNRSFSLWLFESLWSHIPSIMWHILLSDFAFGMPACPHFPLHVDKTIVRGSRLSCKSCMVGLSLPPCIWIGNKMCDFSTALSSLAGRTWAMASAATSSHGFSISENKNWFEVANACNTNDMPIRPTKVG